jgi:sn-glycerol 3-phosphate transport system permease protein
MPLLPGDQLWENYSTVLRTGTTRGITSGPVARMMLNSLIVALAIAFGKIAISIIASFAIVFFRFPLRNFFFWMIFITLMLPVEVRIIPTFKVVADLGMINSYVGLTLPLIASATATFLFRQFFLTVPEELAEAARIDGAGPMRFFWDVVLPLSKTSIAALFVIQFIYGWNQYLWPLLITTDESMSTAVIGIKRMINTGDALTEWNLVMATAMLALLPPALVVMLMQRWFVKGLVETENSNMAELSFRDVKKSYAGLQVIHGVSTEVKDGEFVVIVGRRAAASRRCCAWWPGLEPITGGEIVIGGRVVNELEPKDRDIAMVFQNYALYPHMSVYENMSYGLRIKGFSKAGDRDPGAESGRDPRAEAFPATEDRAPVRRPAPARGDGPRHRARAGGVPVRRAALQPRRQAARADARRAAGPAQAPRYHQPLRHARPGRGDDARAPHDRDERRPCRADRRAARGLRPAGHHLRRELHRFAADEPDPAGARRPQGAVRHPPRAPRALRAVGANLVVDVDLIEPLGADTWSTATSRAGRVSPPAALVVRDAHRQARAALRPCAGALLRRGNWRALVVS